MRRLAWIVVFAACGSDGPPCILDTNANCPETLQCETVAGADQPICVPPVVVVGNVFQSAPAKPGVSGARVLLVDDQGLAVAQAGISDFAGQFEVRVRAPRTADLRPLSARRALRVEASGFQMYPAAYRPAPTIDLADATLTVRGDRFGLTSAATQVALIPAPTGGTATVSGHIALPDPPASVLVVAEPQETTEGGGVSLADSTGAFNVFGLLPGIYLVRGVSLGHAFRARNITLNVGERGTLDIPAEAGTGVRVIGGVSLVGGPTTASLAVAETFEPISPTAEIVPGTQRSLPSAGTFTIEGVPPGRYVVLAGFGIDGFQRAFTTIEVAGTDVTVPPLTLAAALPIVGPGANGPEAVAVRPTIVWQAGGASDYHVEVSDGRGVVIWDRFLPGSATSVAYDGSFTLGGFYQAHVTARDGAGLPLSRTDELRGVFYLPLP
jgi:hypothetical protein